MPPTFFKLLNFTLTTRQFPYMNLVLDLLGESICLFCSWNCTSTSLDCSSSFSNVSWTDFLPNDGFGLVNRMFLVVICAPKPFISIIWQETREIGKPTQKISSQIHTEIFLSKNKVPIYAYAAQLKIFTRYRLIWWYASILGGQIFDNNGVDSLGVMAKISWHIHLIFLIPYDNVARRLPRPPDTLLLGVHGTFCLTSFLEISVVQLCF